MKQRERMVPGARTAQRLCLQTLAFAEAARAACCDDLRRDTIRWAMAVTGAGAGLVLVRPATHHYALSVPMVADAFFLRMQVEQLRERELYRQRLGKLEDGFAAEHPAQAIESWRAVERTPLGFAPALWACLRGGYLLLFAIIGFAWLAGMELPN